MQTIDPILARFRADLDALYGDRLERVVLFGSHTRGDGRPNSGYDVAIFLKDFRDRWTEIDRLIPIVTDILYDEGAFIHATPYGEGAYKEHSPLMHEIRSEGRDI